jgi:hypothetical protein
MYKTMYGWHPGTWKASHVGYHDTLNELYSTVRRPERFDPYAAGLALVVHWMLRERDDHLWGRLSFLPLAHSHIGSVCCGMYCTVLAAGVRGISRSICIPH